MHCSFCGGRLDELARTRKYVWRGCERCLRSWRADALSNSIGTAGTGSRQTVRLSRVVSLLRGAFVSIGAVAFAFALRLFLQPWMGAASPFLLFTPAVMVAAFYAGVSGGALATILGAALGGRFFLSLLAAEPAIERWDRVALFLLTGALITTLTAVLEATRRTLAGSLWREQRARAQAEAANQAKDEFLAVVSHELQTPVSVVLGWLSMIRSQQLTGDALFRALTIIERNAMLETRLVADVLDTSRIVSGTLRLDRERADLAAIVRGAVDQMRPALEARHLQFDAYLPADAWPLEGDPIRLQQVFTNLLSNAAKFTPAGGQVWIAMTRRNNDALVQVSDTGIGISQEFTARVFERFEQEPDALMFSRAGLGLGLSICRYLVDEHGGDISVRSAGRGSGSTFVVRLPLSSSAQTRTDVSSVTLARDALQLRSILVIEGDDDSRLLLSGMLESYGAKVDACRSATEAERSMESSMYDALLCDLRLPDTDGVTFIRRLRHHADHRVASTPAVSIAASMRNEDREEALAAGYQLHLEKPVSADNLAVTLLALVRTSLDATAH
jgi:signal transduction histidine kinase/ActR/RegA family two-component response regulator